MLHVGSCNIIHLRARCMKDEEHISCLTSVYIHLQSRKHCEAFKILTNCGKTGFTHLETIQIYSQMCDIIKRLSQEEKTFQF